jgi:hypothetical protein
MMFASHNHNQAKGPEGRKPERCDSAPDMKTSTQHNLRWQSLAMRSGIVQPKLTIGPADDPYEREADRVADQVMRMPATPSDGHALSITPVTAHQAQRECAECEEEEKDGALQRDESGGAEAPAIAPPIVDQTLNSPGQPLDEETRAYFEPRFGHDFSQVRIHTGGDAVSATRAVRARAFTVADQIAFAAGQYEPRSETGRRLLAHELTHTLQQSQNPGLGVQRSSTAATPWSRAGGCAMGNSDEEAKAIGKLAHLQIQNHVRQNFPVGIEGEVPRGDKGETDGEGKAIYVGTKCPPYNRSVGKVDLYNFQEPVFRFAEIKPFSKYGLEAGPAEYNHYALRLRELKSRYRGGTLCPGDAALGFDKADEDFNKLYLNGYLRGALEREKWDGHPFQPGPLQTPTGEQCAGEFKNAAGDSMFPRDSEGNQVYLYYQNLMKGVVFYECRREKDDNEDDTEEPTNPTSSEPPLTAPFLLDSQPLLQNWLSALEIQPVPEGSGYAVAVSAPIFNALKIGASGQLPFSHVGQALLARAEIFGEGLGAIGLGLVGYGLLAPSSAATGTATAEASALSLPAAEAGSLGVAEGQLGSQATGATMNALRTRAALQSGQAGGGIVTSAIVAPVDPENVEPSPSSLTPGQAQAETALGWYATHYTPVIAAMLDITPHLYFAKTSAEQESEIPLPFTSAEQPDSLGQLAWEGVAALVPSQEVMNPTSLRELGLLKNFILYANPAVIAVYEVSPEELPEIGSLRDIDGFQYIIIANYVGL